MHSATGQLPGAGVLALPMFTFIALLVVATFIDFEHYIIPDEITIGGAVAGVIFSAALPLLHGESDHLRGALMSLLGAGAGFGLRRGLAGDGENGSRPDTSSPMTQPLAPRGATIEPFYAGEIGARAMARLRAGLPVIPMHFGQPSAGIQTHARAAAHASLDLDSSSYWL